MSESSSSHESKNVSLLSTLSEILRSTTNFDTNYVADDTLVIGFHGHLIKVVEHKIYRVHDINDPQYDVYLGSSTGYLPWDVHNAIGKLYRKEEYYPRVLK